MKQRVVSAIVASLILIPIFVIGNVLLKIAVLILLLLGFKEYLSAKENNTTIPIFIKLISYFSIILLYLSNINNDTINININISLLGAIFITLLILSIIYNNKSNYTTTDSLEIYSMIILLFMTFSLFNAYRNMNLKIIIFLFMITIITDSYAYFIGKLIGKNKLIPNISPNKTIEGTIGGSVIGTFVCTIYYLTLINPLANINKLIVVILILSIIGQFGDLFFSSIKRKYKIKDFSNIMPGHGGILDRFDSILFVMLAFTIFIEVI